MTIIFIRTLIVFLALLISMRLMGKRQLGELELSELVVAILISDLAANPLQDIGIPLLNGLIPIIVLLCCELIISAIITKSVAGRVLLCGRPSMLVENGVINQREMHKNRFSLDELTEELRNLSITDISTVQYAVLETDGSLNVVLIPSERPVTAGQMNIQVEDTGYWTIVINDGTLIEKNLKRVGRDERWLQKELSARRVAGVKEVYLLMVDGAGNIFYCAKEARE